jgi:hypothetical protein
MKYAHPTPAKSNYPFPIQLIFLGTLRCHLWTTTAYLEQRMHRSTHKIQHSTDMSDSFAPQPLYSCCTPCEQCRNVTGTHTYLAILSMDALSNTIYLLVHLCAMVVTLLASSGNSEWYSAWMPSTNTSDLPQSLVRLPWQFLCVPARCHTWNWFQYTNTLKKLVQFWIWLINVIVYSLMSNIQHEGALGELANILFLVYFTLHADCTVSSS